MSDSEDEYEIIINNKDIWSFYNDNPNINIEKANLLLIRFMQSIFNNMTSDPNGNINSQLLAYMKDNKSTIDSLKNSLSGITDNISLQLMTIKKEYIEDVKQIVTNNTLTSSEKLSSIIDKNSSHLIDKTTLLLNDIIPRSQDKNARVFQDQFKELHSLISEDTKNLAKSMNSESSLTEFIKTFDTKYQTMMHNIQQPLYSFFSASEDRISKNIDSLKDTSTQSLSHQTKVFEELGEFLGKYKGSSNKGKYGEQQLGSILNYLYPTAEVTNTTGTKASGDFIMKRIDKPSVLFENKEYDYNIPKDEIAKFIRDIDTQNMSGIFISQYSGIAFKQNFQIDINKGNVLVYIQECEYNQDKIRIAVDIVDNLYNKIQDLNTDEDENTISKDILDSINEEYQKFISQKEGMITCLKDFQKRMTSQIDDLQLPVLDKYLEPKYAYVKARCFTCDICNVYTAPSKQSLSAHKRGCKKSSERKPPIK
jgi:hypothetical protein